MQAAALCYTSPMNDAHFKELYGKLNAAQKRAVDAIDGPVMVIAGPGTGKTQILTLRIANILKNTDTPPNAILALTFTEAAAANMRARLVSIIGSAGYYVNIFTFHGFCNHLIAEYPEHFEKIIGYGNASKVDQISIVRNILETHEFKHLKPFGDNFFYVRDILNAIRHLKSEGITIDAFKKICAGEEAQFANRDDLYHEKGAYKGAMKTEYQRELKSIEKNNELAEIYGLYEDALRDHAFYDFEDMILSVVAELERDNNFLLEVEEHYQYLLVDEHQDTNGAQNRILELLASFFERPNLFVVGDEKQAIFRFQGASMDNFLYFKDKYKDVKLIMLDTNYRSTQSILDSSQSLIEKNASLLPGRLIAYAASSLAQATEEQNRASKGEPIAIRQFATEEGERFFLADEIKRLLDGGEKPEEIAVLYRENKDAAPIADFFQRAEIPFVIESDQDILRDGDIRKLNLLCQAVRGLGSDELLIAALHIDFLDLDPLAIYHIVQAAKAAHTNIHDLLENRKKLRTIHGGSAVGTVYAAIKKWRTRSRNEAFLPFFEYLIRESGFLDYLMRQKNYTEKLNLLSALFDEAKTVAEHHRSFSLDDYADYIAILEEHGVMIRASVHRMPSAVRLMTAHKAKGLEFNHVFIAGSYDAHWGNKRSMEKFDLPLAIRMDVTELERNEDERRLFYMALTRARRMVTITYARYARDGRERVPSQFIEEIKPELKRTLGNEDYEARAAQYRELFFAEKKRTGTTAADPAFVRELFSVQGLSATALNNYLTCPWRYFYSSLVRIPQAMNKFAMYGTAIHGALENFFNARNESAEADDRFLVDRFLFHLGRQPLAEREYKETAEQGSTTLAAYYKNYSSTWNYHTVNEYHSTGVLLTPTIKLTGKLDKLELQRDAREVIVVDYKTKKPESRNWIEGKTKTSDGNFKRQLVFYKLLLDLRREQSRKNDSYRMIGASIDFVEPSDRGKFVREDFEITESEVEALKELIKKSAEEILTLSFWDRRCGEKSCHYCALRDMMK